MPFTRNTLGANVRKSITEMLNQSLADAIDLTGQCKQAHWNVKGRDFIALHEMFDEIHADMGGHVDTIAERITQLGGVAHGTSRTVASNTSLPAYPEEAGDGMFHLQHLGDAFAKFGKSVRENIDKADDAGDKDTADLYTEVSRAVDKHLWFIDAHLDGSPAATPSKGAKSAKK